MRKSARSDNKKKRRLTNKENVIEKNVPRSFVFHRGVISSNVKGLLADIKTLMSPYTSLKLMAKKKNTLKEFIHISSEFKVTHFIIISQTQIGILLKIVRVPQGPTLTFRIDNYSLIKDLLKIQSKVIMGDYLLNSAPCLITNLQPTEGETQLQLCSKMFLNMFPTISPATVKTKDIRRCCLLNYSEETKTFDLRHYAITMKMSSVSRATRKFVSHKVPDLSDYKNVAEYVKVESGAVSEAEDEATEPIEVDRVVKGKVHKRQSVVKLIEIGPRIDMTLLKIESGVCEGTVLYHHFVTKTDEEIMEIRKKIQQNRKLKKKRIQEQEANVKAKEDQKEEHRRRCMEGMRDNEPLDGNESEDSIETDKHPLKKRKGDQKKLKTDQKKQGTVPAKRSAGKKFNPKYKVKKSRNK